MHYLKLIRPLNLLMIVFTMVLFRVCIIAASPYKIFYIQPEVSTIAYLFMVLATVLIAAGGYVVNDIYDIEIDAVNRPEKQIIGKHISETEAYNFYKILCVLGVLCTLVLAFLTRNLRLSMLPLIIMLILNFYAHTFKKQFFVGNFMIALSTGFVVLLPTLFEIGGKVDDSDMQLEIQSGIAIAGIVYGLFAFLSTFLRELVKDMEDVNGDIQGNCKTIPIVLGINSAKGIAIFITIILFIQLALFVWFFPSIQVKYVAYIIAFGLLLPLLLISIFIVVAKSAKQYYYASNLIKLFMLLGISTMLYFKGGIGPYIFMQFANFIEKLL
ncbi:MAG TPA: geranylgeranylglycerol-phosphate geranylgeranyltransferase [Chitinophagales bacterium]|nr:geranylgeranylglycerol-phosphate geranylgeranyltransferase [Chitinophagales bacterium]